MTKNVDLNAFIEAWNDTKSYPTIADVAEVCGITPKTARNKAGFLRNISKSDPNAPKIVIRSSTSEVPLSEDTSKFMPDWTPEDCIAELRRIQALN